MDATSTTLADIDFPRSGHFLAGRLRYALSFDDLLYIENLIERTEHHADQTRLVTRGELTDRAMMLIKGFMFRTIEDGDGRYIVGVHLPGDFVDLHGFALKRLDHNLVAAGPVEVGVVSHARLGKVMVERPGVARAMWFATLLDAAIHRKWIEILEKLDAPRRIAHLFCELQARLELIGQAKGGPLRTPFTQTDLADMCGVTAIHANRAVGKLREMNLGDVRRGNLYPVDWSALREFSGFDPDYLYGPGELKLSVDWT